MNKLEVAVFSFIYFGLIAIVSPGWAADCKPLQLLNSVKLAPIAGDSRVAVPVSINGIPEKLLLDSGASITTLSIAAANSLGLGLSPSRVIAMNMIGGAAFAVARVGARVVSSWRRSLTAKALTPFQPAVNLGSVVS